MRTHRATLFTDDQICAMRRDHRNGKSQKYLQAKYDITQGMVSGILTYRYYKHVKCPDEQ
jgi:hypothetical protein